MEEGATYREGGIKIQSIFITRPCSRRPCSGSFDYAASVTGRWLALAGLPPCSHGNVGNSGNTVRTPRIPYWLFGRGVRGMAQWAYKEMLGVPCDVIKDASFHLFSTIRSLLHLSSPLHHGCQRSRYNPSYGCESVDNSPPYVKPSTRLRQLLAEPGCLQAPGVYDGMSARLAIEAGFKCMVRSLYWVWQPFVDAIQYMSGAMTTASKLGLPDLAFASLNDFAANGDIPTLTSLSPSSPTPTPALVGPMLSLARWLRTTASASRGSTSRTRSR